MKTGPLVRKPTNHKKYVDYLANKSAGCDFCTFTSKHSQVNHEYTLFWVVENIFPYDTWDGLTIDNHLLVVPKRHIDSIAHFTKAEQQQYVSILGEYEQLGYSVYARAPQAVSKTVVHQHTHLIKLTDQQITSLIYLRKPHILKYR